MNVLIKPSCAMGEVKAPPSKSMAHRLLICAALSDGVSKIDNIAYSEDILATLDCLKAMGAGISKEETSVTVEGIKNKTIPSTVRYECRESGSTLRFFIGIALAIGNESHFYGTEKLLSRPLSVYEDICREQNIEYRAGDHISIKGNIKPGIYDLPGNISSQFITGLLFGLVLLDKDSQICFNTEIESRSYIDLTLDALSQYEVEVKWTDERTIFIKGGQTYKSRNTVVEGDYSNAAFLDIFNTLGGNVKVTGLRKESLQGDRVYKDFFEQLTKERGAIDICDCPDLGPALMVVAAANKGAVFTGTKRLKIKESDRGSVMCELLSRFGIKTVFEEDCIEVTASALKAPKEPIDTHNDHRIVMAAASLLSITGGELAGASAVRKSFPDYFEQIKHLNIEVETDGLDK